MKTLLLTTLLISLVPAISFGDDFVVPDNLPSPNTAIFQDKGKSRPVFKFVDEEETIDEVKADNSQQGHFSMDGDNRGNFSNSNNNNYVDYEFVAKEEGFGKDGSWNYKSSDIINNQPRDNDNNLGTNISGELDGQLSAQRSYQAKREEVASNNSAKDQDYSAQDIKVNNPRQHYFKPKTPTPGRLFSANLSRPEMFVSSNNLIKKPGSFYQAVGEVVHIKGKVTDSFGVPIMGALIEVWQTNSAGKYQTLIEKNSEFMDVNFNMSGRAITDNLGNYNFITVMPGSYLNRAPHINFNVYHKSFGSLETEMYFSKHPMNISDHEYLSYSNEDQELLTSRVKLSNMFDKDSLKICVFNIVLDGTHKYKSFGGV